MKAELSEMISGILDIQFQAQKQLTEKRPGKGGYFVPTVSLRKIERNVKLVEVDRSEVHKALTKIQARLFKKINYCLRLKVATPRQLRKKITKSTR